MPLSQHARALCSGCITGQIDLLTLRFAGRPLAHPRPQMNRLWFFYLSGGRFLCLEMMMIRKFTY